MAFGKQDVVAPGFREAAAAATATGFLPIIRLAGGRAAVFHEGTLAFSWMIPDPDPRRNIRKRYRELSDLMVRAFTRLGAHAAVGEVPGEYCPGEYSVHVHGRKVMGVGQRLARHATHIGGVIVVRDTALTRNALLPVYAALELDWNPATVGSLSDELPGVTLAVAAEAVLAEFASFGTLVPGRHDAGTLSLAESFVSDHLVSS